MPERQVCFDTELEGFPRHKYCGPRGDIGVLNNLQAERAREMKFPLQNIKTRSPPTIQRDVQQIGVDGEDPIFYQDLNVLIRCDRISEFYPARNLSKTRKLNAIARFTLYFAILYFFATGNAFLPLVGLVALYLVAKYYLPRWTETFCQSQPASRQQGGLGFGFGACTNLASGNCASYPYAERDVRRQQQGRDRWCCDKDPSLGIQPTCDNPFMNPTVNDFLTNVDRGPAPDINEEPVSSQVNNLFTDRLYLDIDDIWQRRNGQRQFVTNPNTTIPNDQEGFARFLFDNPNHAGRESYICKNDVRFNHCGPNIKALNGLCR